MQYAMDQIRLLIAEWLLGLAFHICASDSPEKTDFALAQAIVYGRAMDRERLSRTGDAPFKSVRGKHRFEGYELVESTLMSAGFSVEQVSYLMTLHSDTVRARPTSVEGFLSWCAANGATCWWDNDKQEARIE